MSDKPEHEDLPVEATQFKGSFSWLKDRRRKRLIRELEEIDRESGGPHYHENREDKP